jgi:hypothetical protein
VGESARAGGGEASPSTPRGGSRVRSRLPNSQSIIRMVTKVYASEAAPSRGLPANNEMNRTNREVPGMKERRASGEPVLAEVGAPVILSLDVAGYLSVMRPWLRRVTGALGRVEWSCQGEVAQ